MGLLFSCSQTKDITGLWIIDLNLQDKTLPVRIQIESSSGNILKGKLFNSDEVISLTGQIDEEKQFTLEIGASYGVLEGKFLDDSLNGHWVRTNKENYKVSFLGRRHNQPNEHIKSEQEQNLINMSGNWELKLGEEGVGLGRFKQSGSRVQGSILTPTGDYRFLDGVLQNNSLTLYGFDGTFSFIVELVISGNKLNGTMFAGKSYSEKIEGTKNDSFELPDASTLSRIDIKGPLKLKATNDLDGNIVNISANDQKEKIKIIQIFGSWCPNCIDETKFFLNWKKANLAMANQISFVALAFEKFEKEADAVKALRKIKVKLGLDYPVILADYKNTNTVKKWIPLDEVKAFPTTIFLNKENMVVKVHTGFSGQATGIFFDQFKEEFQKTVKELLKK